MRGGSLSRPRVLWVPHLLSPPPDSLKLLASEGAWQGWPLGAALEGLDRVQRVSPAVAACTLVAIWHPPRPPSGIWGRMTETHGCGGPREVKARILLHGEKNQVWRPHSGLRAGSPSSSAVCRGEDEDLGHLGSHGTSLAEAIVKAALTGALASQAASALSGFVPRVLVYGLGLKSGGWRQWAPILGKHSGPSGWPPSGRSTVRPGQATMWPEDPEPLVYPPLPPLGSRDSGVARCLLVRVHHCLSCGGLCVPGTGHCAGTVTRACPPTTAPQSVPVTQGG